MSKTTIQTDLIGKRVRFTLHVEQDDKALHEHRMKMAKEPDAKFPLVDYYKTATVRGAYVGSEGREKFVMLVVQMDEAGKLAEWPAMSCVVLEEQ